MPSKIEYTIFHGPLAKTPGVKLWCMYDPLGLGFSEVYSFDIDLWTVYSTESQYEVRTPLGRMIDSGSLFSDFYGHGHSIFEAVEEAEHKLKDIAGSNLDVRVVTTLTKTLVVNPKVGAFYRGSVSAQQVPLNQWFYLENGEQVDQPISDDDQSIVWHNGEYTDAFYILKEKLIEIQNLDAAAGFRSGSLIGFKDMSEVNEGQ